MASYRPGPVSSNNRNGNGSSTLNMSLQVRPAVPSSSISIPDRSASVFVAIDTSGSMSGSKLNQVCNSLEQIIQRSPAQVRFTIRIFNDEVKTVVTKKKHFIDLARLRKSILDSCKGRTALFDAWGQTIVEIPYNTSKDEFVRILVFTDGEDNVSKEHHLESIIKLVQEKVRGKRHLTFIQAGPYRGVLDEVKGKCNSVNVSAIDVEDTADGIRIAFDKIEQQLCIDLKFHLDTNGPVPNEIVSSLAAQVGNMLNVTGTGHKQRNTAAEIRNVQPLMALNVNPPQRHANLYRQSFGASTTKPLQSPVPRFGSSRAPSTPIQPLEQSPGPPRWYVPFRGPSKPIQPQIPSLGPSGYVPFRAPSTPIIQPLLQNPAPVGFPTFGAPSTIRSALHHTSTGTCVSGRHVQGPAALGIFGDNRPERRQELPGSNILSLVHKVTNKNNFDTKLKEAGSNLVVVEFYIWYGPSLSTKLEELAKQMTRVKFLKVDVDQCEDIASLYNISNMPTFIFFKHGVKVNEFFGADDEKLREIITKLQ